MELLWVGDSNLRGDDVCFDELLPIAISFLLALEMLCFMLCICLGTQFLAVEHTLQASFGYEGL